METNSNIVAKTPRCIFNKNTNGADFVYSINIDSSTFEKYFSDGTIYIYNKDTKKLEFSRKMDEEAYKNLLREYNEEDQLMDVGILSYKKLKGGHFYVETSNGCYYVKDTRKDIGDDCSCRLCCEVFQGVKKSSEASETNKVCDRDTLLFISQNIERYLRNHEQSLEAANIALSLGAIDGFTKENRTQYMFFAR